MANKSRISKYLTIFISLLILLFLANNIAKLFWAWQQRNIVETQQLENLQVTATTENLYGLDKLIFKAPENEPSNVLITRNNLSDNSINNLVENNPQILLQGIYFEKDIDSESSNKNNLIDDANNRSFRGTTDNSSIAIINYNNQIKTFHINDLLGNGIRIVAINKDNIVVSHNGKNKVIYLTYKTLENIERLVSNKSRLDIDLTSNDDSTGLVPNVYNPKVSNSDDDLHDNLKRYLANDDFIASFLHNQLVIMDYVDFIDAKLTKVNDAGFVVRNKKSVDVLAKFGLKNDDVLLAVNDININQNNMLEIVNILEINHPHASTIKIMRNGAIKFIKLDFFSRYWQFTN